MLNELREIVANIEMPYVQILEPFFSHTFLRLYPPQLGVDAVELLEDFFRNPSEQERILNDLKLGMPKKIIVRPASHARDKNDLELLYDHPKEKFLPRNDFAEGARLIHDDETGANAWQVDFTIKTCASGNILRTLETLIEDMIQRKQRQPAHGLLIFFIAGYPPNIPEHEITLKTRFFMVLVAIPLKVITIMEKIQQDGEMTTSESKVGIFQLLKKRIENIIEEKKEKDNMAVLNVISPERSLLYYTTNRTAFISLKIERMDSDITILKSDVATLKSDVATLKSDVATLKSDVATLKSDVATLKSDSTTLKSKLDQIIDLLKRMK